MHSLIAAALCLVLMAACSGYPPGQAPASPTTPVDPMTSVGVPTEGPWQGTPPPCPASYIEGRLIPHPDRGAVLEVTPEDVVMVAWPYGYSGALIDGRFALLDTAGAVVAREGDRVRIGGGERPDGFWRGCGGTVVLGP